MRRGVLLAGGATCLGLMLSCSGDDATGSSPYPGSWYVLAPPFEGAWTRCDARSDGTLWATVILTDSKRAAIIRYQDHGWDKAEFEPVVTEALNDILMFDDGRGWACGNASVILEYRGDSWSARRLRNNIEYFHLGGADSSHVWVNGISRPWGTPYIFYNDGRGWREAPTPVGFSSFGPLYMSAPEKGFMVGRKGAGDEILRLDGLYWRPAITFPERLHFYDLEGAGAVTYAVGERRLGRERLGRIYQLTPYVKDITPATPSPEEYYYRACYVDAEGGLWASAAPYGASTTDYELLYWDGETWAPARIANETGTAARFFDLDFEGGTGWAVGGTTYARYQKP